ncbi:MAG: DUF6186 family protein [Actinomycetota bacterium]|nr:DUF6186 family protein [Actinomycetota bacterium]
MTAGLVIGAWVVLLAAGAACEMLARSGGRVARLGMVSRAVVSRRLGTVVLLLAWAWLGWHVFAR